MPWASATRRARAADARCTLAPREPHAPSSTPPARAAAAGASPRRSRGSRPPPARTQGVFLALFVQPKATPRLGRGRRLLRVPPASQHAPAPCYSSTPGPAALHPTRTPHLAHLHAQRVEVLLLRDRVPVRCRDAGPPVQADLRRRRECVVWRAAGGGGGSGGASAAVQAAAAPAASGTRPALLPAACCLEQSPCCPARPPSTPPGPRRTLHGEARLVLPRALAVEGKLALVLALGLVQHGVRVVADLAGLGRAARGARARGSGQGWRWAAAAALPRGRRLLLHKPRLRRAHASGRCCLAPAGAAGPQPGVCQPPTPPPSRAPRTSTSTFTGIEGLSLLKAL
jgi:hypothetical protein